MSRYKGDYFEINLADSLFNCQPLYYPSQFANAGFQFYDQRSHLTLGQCHLRVHITILDFKNQCDGLCDYQYY